jgi:hypothetical protein
MYLLGKIGGTRLTPEAVDLAAATWVQAPLDQYSMAALYVLLKDAPADKRATITAAAMAAIDRTLAGADGDVDSQKLDTCDGAAWLYFTVRLMEGTKPDADTLKRVRKYRDVADALVREGPPGLLGMETELRDAADQVLAPSPAP